MENAKHAHSPAKKRTPKPHRYSRSVRITAISTSALLTILGIGCVGLATYFLLLFGRVNYAGDGDHTGLEVPADDVVEKPADAVEFDPSDYANSSLAEIPVLGNTSEITNILLIGVDGQDYQGNADTNIIVSINSRTKTVKLISLMRDVWVTIPGRDWNGDGMDDYAKFNNAYASGGFSLHSKMIEQNYRLKLDKYIAVNFEAFPKVIDALGGTDVQMTGGEAERVPAAGSQIRYGGAGYIPMGTTDGMYHMDGFQTLQFARLRYYYADSDFTRTSNQRKLIEQLMNKAKDMSIGQLNGLLFEALGVVSTNMDPSEFLGFTANALSYRNYAIDTSYRVPQDDAWASEWIGDGVGLALLDPEDSVLRLQEFIYG
ncbi:MAG: LCP family protein [Acutalibacteraceae bacterium]